MFSGGVQGISNQRILRERELFVEDIDSLLGGRVHPSLPLYRGVL